MNSTFSIISNPDLETTEIRLNHIIYNSFFYIVLFAGLRVVLRYTNRITILSFNYGAINTNPFEFDDNSKLLSKANNMLDYSVGKWDLSQDRYTKKRFSPLYEKNIKFGLTVDEFDDIWTKTWNTIYPYVDPGNLLDFDREIYKTLNVVYTPFDFKKMFDKPYVNEEKKIKMIAKFVTNTLNNCGIAIIQEMNRESIDRLLYDLSWTFSKDKFRSFESEGHTTITLIITYDIEAHQIYFPNVNKETVAIRITKGKLKNFLVVGSHFTSKSDEKADRHVGHESNYRDLKKAISGERLYIAGFDANHEINDTSDTNILPTSVKLRTKFQVQDKYKVVSSRIDYIDYRGQGMFANWQTVYSMITGSNIPCSMPNEEMPLDHAVRILFLR